MKNLKKQITQLNEVKHVIKLAIESSKIFCIGVDGPTASGKTIFAELLSQEIKKLKSNKIVKVVPLDYLLIERKFREKSLENILNSKIHFEHEAELHMDFHRIKDISQTIKDIKLGINKEKRLIIKNLYSRENKGKCTSKLDIHFHQNLIIIFEGHYTIRPTLFPVIDKNFILLAHKETLINRKVERSSNYRNTENVKKYFEYIDEPSYLSNYSRFANESSIIIDNTEFSNPKISNLNTIYNLLDYSHFLSNKNHNVKVSDYFIFGNHGISQNKTIETATFKKCVSKLNNIKKIITRNKIYEIFNKLDIDCKIVYFKVYDLKNYEVGFYTKFFGQEVQWVLCLKDSFIKNLIFWEGGCFVISNENVTKLQVLYKKNFSLDLSAEKLLKKLSKNTNFFTECFINNKLINNHYYFSLLEHPRENIFIYTALKYSQFSPSMLGDVLFVTHKRIFINSINHLMSEPDTLAHRKINFFKKNDLKNLDINNQRFFLSEDILVLKTQLNKKILEELSKIYKSSKNHNLRSIIFRGLLYDHNKKYISTKFKNYLKYLISFFPSSMSRLYTLKRLKLINTNVMAANIYDIKKTSIDAKSFLSVSFKKSLPLIIQISQNAVGQKEVDKENISIGYLKPRHGIYDFTNTISHEIIQLIEPLNVTKNKHNFFGIGLDHVDVKGNFPEGRSKRFVKQSIKSELITHFTLDGSDDFKPKNNNISEITEAYIKVFNTALSFWGNQEINSIDLEFCTGELNYIGKKNKPHYPSGKEIGFLPYCFQEAIKKNYDTMYGLELDYLLKLYVGNLGTSHHETDTSSNLKIENAKDWQKNLLKSNFISPVLHGTTGSTDDTFIKASKYCFKINIAGSFLKIFLDNLTENQKKEIYFSKFDHNSKYLCSNFDKIDKDQCVNTTDKLKESFEHYCSISNVSSLSKNELDIVRKPFFGRNIISETIFKKLEEML